jgi:tRNA(His) 5'-end guanylyltransferase
MSDLGDRMKENYENRWRFYLPRRIPVIIRVDGRAFHTLMKDARKPFDETFRHCMAVAAKETAAEMQGCKAVYVQSDEASFFLTDYDELTTQAWFDYNKSKIETTAAALMSVRFSGHYMKLATFDARAFSIPKEEVVNYFVWRAKDWARNSLQMLARQHYTHRDLLGKDQAALHQMLHRVGINWAELGNFWKNGTWWIRNDTGWSVINAIRPEYSEIANYLDASL